MIFWYLSVGIKKDKNLFIWGGGGGGGGAPGEVAICRYRRGGGDGKLSVRLSQGGFETYSICSGEGWVYVPGVFTTLNIRPLGIIQRNSICRKGCSAKSVCPMGGLKQKYLSHGGLKAKVSVSWGLKVKVSVSGAVAVVVSVQGVEQSIR